MRVGAVITAAGMSTRMGDFKQLMKLGPHSLIEHVVDIFEQTHISEIVVVIGYRADEIMDALTNHNVTFVYNEGYENTQMLTSVKLGLKAIQDKVDRVFFCPCDVAAFSVETVKRLADAEGLVLLPSYEGRTGHPICLASSLIPVILEYEGSEGLKGAINSIDITPVKIEVYDEGILKDADTMADYEGVRTLYEKKFKV